MYRAISLCLLVSTCSAFFYDSGKDYCKNFLPDAKFDINKLEGQYTVVYTWPGYPDIKREDVIHQRLTPEQVNGYRNEVDSAYNSTISWKNVSHSVILRNDIGVAVSKDEINDIKYLLEIDGDTGAGVAIPVGDLFKFMNSAKRLFKLRFQYKNVGDYLAAMFCPLKHGYLLSKTLPKVSELEEVVAGITVEDLHGGVAYFEPDQ